MVSSFDLDRPPTMLTLGAAGEKDEKGKRSWLPDPGLPQRKRREDLALFWDSGKDSERTSSASESTRKRRNRRSTTRRVFGSRGREEEEKRE